MYEFLKIMLLSRHICVSELAVLCFKVYVVSFFSMFSERQFFLYNRHLLSGKFVCHKHYSQHLGRY